ncbi:hypothetical protein H6G76_01755 [Nostoc sp. FACHB-152]|uniref:hypothetical protein n=1 Tax=unclassified Nostoc TaxID=2593658 RepID=UPI001683D12D|nr:MULTISPECIES: hypothetical protein [unclassified Nostoc]MBD2445897.1 hypothetical protein [Nostoc sp. FACHB-152]MBD2467927.1 hypothetical protein [Nostoc sp. FACHB-145]
MLHINLNQIAGNHVGQSSFTDNSNQYQLRSLTDDKTPQLCLKIEQHHRETMQYFSEDGQTNSGDRCVKISHQFSKQHLITLLTRVAQLH